MNHVYKVIWSKTKHCYIVASELAHRDNKHSGSSHNAKKAAIAMAVMLTLGMAIPQVSQASLTEGITKEGAIAAIGTDTWANGANNIAIGKAASAGDKSDTEKSQVDAIAIGTNAEAAKERSSAFGAYAKAMAKNATAFGEDATASGENAVAVGSRSRANNIEAVAIGYNTNTERDSLSDQYVSVTAGEYSSAIGPNATASGTASVALGLAAKSQGEHSLALGAWSAASGNNSIAVGNGAKAEAENATALGFEAEATGAQSVALGLVAKSQGENSLALGGWSAASGKNSIAVGTKAKAGAVGSIAVGEYTEAIKPSATALGDAAKATATKATALGVGAHATGENSVALGANSQATGANSLATGFESVASGDDSIATGLKAQASGTDSIATGTRSQAEGKGSVAIGKYATATKPSAIALGGGAKATEAKSVALGNGSVTSKAHTGTKAKKVTLNGVTTTFAGVASNKNGTVSVGSKGAERQVQNVAAGDIATTSTDAINGSQLYATNQAVAGLNQLVDEGLKFGANNGKPATNKLGSTVSIIGGGSKSDKYYSDQNIKTIVSQDRSGTTTIDIMMDKDLQADSLTVGKKKTRTEKGTNGSINIINKDGTSADIGVGEKRNDITRLVYKDAKNTQHQVATLDDGMNYAGDSGSKLSMKLNSTVAIKGGVTKEKKLSDDNIGVVSDGENTLTVKLAKELKGMTSTQYVDANARLGTTINSKGVTIENGKNDVKLTKKGLNNGGNKITNLAQGTALTDAVNVSQLNAVKSDITNKGLSFSANSGKDWWSPKTVTNKLDSTVSIIGGGDKPNSRYSDQNIKTIVSQDRSGNTTIDVMMDKDLKVDSLSATNSINVDGNTYISDSGINANNHKVVNVDKGLVNQCSTEAVNGSQLYEVERTIGDTSKINKDIKNVNFRGNTMTTSVVDALNNLDNSAVKYVSGRHGKVDYSKIILNGAVYDSKTHSGGTSITNVAYATGKDDSAAVSVGYLKDNIQKLSDNSIKNITLTKNINDAGSTLRYTKGDNTSVDVSTSVATTDYQLVKNEKSLDGKYAVDTKHEANLTVKDSISGTSQTVTISNIASASEVGDISTINQDIKNQTGETSVVEALNNLDNKVGDTTTLNKDLQNTDTTKPTTVVDAINNLDNAAVKYDTKTDGTINKNSVTMAGDTYQTKTDGTHTGGTSITNVAYADGTDGSAVVNVDKLNNTVDQKLKVGTQGLVNGVTLTKNTGNAGSTLSYTTLGSDKATTVSNSVATTDYQLVKNAESVDGKYAVDTNHEANLIVKDSISGVSQTVTISNIASASEVGKVSDLSSELQSSDSASSTTVVGAVNTLNDKVNLGWTSQVDGQNVQNIKMGGSQNFVSGDNIVLSNDNGAIKVSTASDVTFNKVTADEVKVGDTVTINKDGIDAGSAKITNVADGAVSAGSTDAVNGGQLYDFERNASDSISKLGNSVNKLDDRMNKVGAGAAALAALHPLDFNLDDKWDFAVGYGNYRNANAAAIGAFYRPNEDTMFSMGGSFGNGENMLNVGVSFKLGQGNHTSTSRVAMVKEMQMLKQQNQQVVAKNEQLTAEIAEIKAQVAALARNQK